MNNELESESVTPARKCVCFFSLIIIIFFNFREISRLLAGLALLLRGYSANYFMFIVATFSCSLFAAPR